MYGEEAGKIKVAITGQGRFSPFGRGDEALSPFRAGMDRSERINRDNKLCPLSSQDHGITGELGQKGWRASLLAIAASRTALAQAYPGSSGIHRQTGVIIGTSLLDISALEHYLAIFRQQGPKALPPWALHYGLPLAHASHIAVSLRLQGMCETLSDPLTSGLHALGMGYRALTRAEVPALLAGGVDSPSGNLLFPALAGIYSKNSPDKGPVELAEGCAIFHLQGEKAGATPSASRPLAYICGYATARMAGKKNEKEALLQQLAAEAFPDGEGVDLLLDTATLPAPFPGMLAAGPALACGLAVAWMQAPNSDAWKQFSSLQPEPLSPLRNREAIRRAIVFADGPAGESAAIALAAPWDRDSGQYKEQGWRNNQAGRGNKYFLFSPSGQQMSASKAVITGMGVASALGLGRDTFFQALLNGASGAEHYLPPGANKAGPSTAALVRGMPAVAGMPRNTQLACAAAKEALTDAGLMTPAPGGAITDSANITPGRPAGEERERISGNSKFNRTDPGLAFHTGQKGNQRLPSQQPGKNMTGKPTIGLYLGETLSCVEAWIHLEKLLREDEKEHETDSRSLHDALNSLRQNTKDQLVSRFQLGGEAVTFASGCTSGLLALGRAAKNVEYAGQVPGPLFLAGGTDSNLFPLAFGILSRAKLLTTCPDPRRAGRPFDRERDGELTGEGSALFVIEHPDSAAQRGVKPYAVLSGFGSAGDGHHFKYNKPDGAALVKAVQKALEQAGLNASKIDLVIAHASGFKGSDAIEVKALSTLFKVCQILPPVVSIKGATGQPFSAGGPLQVAAALCALQTGTIPPTAHFSCADEDDPFDHVPTARQAEKPIQHVLVTSYGYGGGKAALILSAWGDTG